MTESEATPSGWPARLREHVQQRTIVLPEHKVLFFPMPKAGCTSMLWLLAELAGLSADDFSRSGSPEISPALLVHDLTRWPSGHRLGSLDADERERALHEDGWFRFTIVRDPAPRLWSAWQSKLLLREPKFHAKFGDHPWFPRLPVDPDEVVADFHAFIAVLGQDGTEDVHWAVQSELSGTLPLAHVGRVESMDDTLAALRAHLGDTAPRGALRQDNRTPLPMPAHAYPPEVAVAVDAFYRADFDAFGYPTVASRPMTTDDWAAQVKPLLPLVRDLIDHNERIGQLSRLARDRKDKIRSLKGDLRGSAD
jgi:hypothetical protein